MESTSSVQTEETAEENIEEIPLSAKEKGEYTPEMKDVLLEKDLPWFAENPCVSADRLKSFKELDLSNEQMQKLLEGEKTKLEDFIRRSNLGEKPVELSPNQTHKELRCLLLGNVGEGKSSLGNLLTASEAFKVYDSPTPGTKESSFFFSRKFNIKIFDTRGLQDCEGSEFDLDVAKIFTIFREGIHAFIIVMSLANPRISDSDVKVFKELQDRFGEEILHHTFIAFTRSRGYLGSDKDKTLKTYVDEMNGTPLVEALQVIGDNVIAVENNGEVYLKKLTRQATLDLISESVSLSTNGCYTHALFREVEERMRKKKDEIQAERHRQLTMIENHAKPLIQAKLSAVTDIQSLQKMLNEDKQNVLTELNERLKEKATLEWVSMESQMVLINHTLERLLDELVVENLRTNTTAFIKSSVDDPEKSLDEYLKSLRGHLSFPIERFGENFIRSEIRQKSQELQALQKDKRKHQQEKVCQLILKHVELFDNQAKIQEMLVVRSDKFSGDEMLQLIEDCMETKEIRNAIMKEEERRKRFLEEQKKHIEQCVKPLIMERLTHAGKVREAIMLIDHKRSQLLTDLLKQLRQNKQLRISWMPPDEENIFQTEIISGLLDELVLHDLGERTRSILKSQIASPKENPKRVSKWFQDTFLSLFLKVGEDVVLSHAREIINDLRDNDSLANKEDIRPRAPLQNKVFAFILEHIDLFDNPAKIQEMLVVRSDKFSGDEMLQLIEDCMETKEIRDAIMKEEERRKRFIEKRRKHIAETVKQLIEKRSSEARRMENVIEILFDERQQFLSDVYEELTKNKGLRFKWLPLDRERDIVTTISSGLLGELSNEHLRKKMTQTVNRMVTNHKESIANYCQLIEAKHSRWVGIVGKDFVHSEVRRVLVNRKELAQKILEEENERKQQRQSIICTFVLDHIDLSDNVAKIQELLIETNEEFKGFEMLQLIEECMEGKEMRNAIKVFKEKKKSEAEKVIAKIVDDHVARFVTDKNSDFLLHIRDKRVKYTGVISLLAKAVRREAKPETGDIVPLAEIEDIVKDTLGLTLENITDLPIFARAKLFLKPILHLNLINRLFGSSDSATN